MKKVLYSFLTLILAANTAQATDGSLGTTSTGTSDLRVTIADLVRITNVGNLDFGSYSGSGALDANDNVCIYRNIPAATYRVTASANEGSFVVKSGADSIAYSVFWNHATGTTGETAVSYSSPTATQTGANNTSEDCGGGASLNANFHVHFDASPLQAAPAGIYTGTLVLFVEPV